jgi:hypothetical protein
MVQHVDVELVAAEPHHLHLLLTASQPDHLFVAPSALFAEPLADFAKKKKGTPATSATFCLEDPADQSSTDNRQLGRAIYMASMVWAYTAKALAGLSCKTSLVTHASKAMSTLDYMQDSFDRFDLHVHKTVRLEQTGLRAEPGLLQCLARGVAKTHFMEDRTDYGTAIDLSGSALLSVQQLLWLAASSGEYAVALRDGQVLGERLIKLGALPRQDSVSNGSDSAAHVLKVLRLRPSSTCVVTGGTQGLGLELARQLVARGCRQLVLTSRTGAIDPDALVRLRRTGAKQHHRNVEVH